MADVIAELKSIYASGEDAPPGGSFEDCAPTNRGHFGVRLQVFIGTTDDDLFDSFDVIVCSPSWFSDQVDAGAWERFRSGGLRALPESIAVGSGIWFMRHWDSAAVLDGLHAVCQGASPGPDWGSVAARIGRLIPWEFDERHDSFVNANFGQPFPTTQ